MPRSLLEHYFWVSGAGGYIQNRLIFELIDSGKEAHSHHAGYHYPSIEGLIRTKMQRKEEFAHGLSWDFHLLLLLDISDSSSWTF